MTETAAPRRPGDRLRREAQARYALAAGYGRTWLSIPTWGMLARNVRSALLRGRPFVGALHQWSAGAAPGQSPAPPQP